MSVGVTSVLLGTVMWMGANGQLVHADVVNSSQSNVVDNEMRENSVPLSKVSQVQDNNQSSVSSPQNSKSSNNTAASQKTITIKIRPSSPPPKLNLNYLMIVVYEFSD